MERLQEHESEVSDKIVQLPVSSLATALSRAQGVMSGAKKGKNNPFFKSSYADLASVFDAIREPFSKNGLAISQTMDILADGKTVLITRLMHSSGEFIDSKMMLPIDPNPQKVGSCLTYYRRYALMAVAGIPAEDDDGNTASGKPTYITPKQVAALKCIINGNMSVHQRVLENCANGLESITVEHYPGAVNWIKGLMEKSNDK